MTEVKPVVKVKKIDQCRAIYQEIFTRGYDLKGKGQRAHFIERSMSELGISKHCAGTYYQNLSNEAGGQPLYKYNKTAPKKSDAATALEQLAETAQVAQERWFVVNAEGQEVNNFKTRAEAQKFAKENDLEWKDRSKAA